MNHPIKSLVLALSIAGACSGASATRSHGEPLIANEDAAIGADNFERFDWFEHDAAKDIFKGNQGSTEGASGWTSHGQPWTKPGSGYGDFSDKWSGHHGHGDFGGFDGLHNDGPGCAPAVPEPQESALLVAGLGAIGLVVVRRRQSTQR